jgi:uncharacterized protein involved in outer membrane biogenesis
MAMSNRKRRFLKFLAVFGIIIAIAAWWINDQLEPHKLTRTVLGKLGKELNLEFDFEGQPSYAMKPEPRLIIPNLAVNNPTNHALIFSAKNVEISLPWSTITGDTPYITRIEADEPWIDLPQLSAWQATRPSTKPFEVPTFTNGLQVSNGTVRDDDYRIENIQLDLSHLENQQPIKTDILANILIDKTIIGLAGELEIKHAGLVSDFSLHSKQDIKINTDTYPYELRLNGHYKADDSKKIEITSQKYTWQSQTPLPNIHGNLGLLITDAGLNLKTQGTLAQWLKEWPILPAPLNKQTKDIPFNLEYAGKFNFSDAFKLNLQLQNTKFQSELKIAELQQWVGQTNGTPLPPLKGKFDTPKIEMDGVSLEGVSIEITPDP